MRLLLATRLWDHETSTLNMYFEIAGTKGYGLSLGDVMTDVLETLL